jgi:DNA polymerase I-like protein with 3'-5' exonuclease and polymerase domains
VSKGYKVVAFAHDEAVVEAGEGEAERVRDEVALIMNESMNEVLNGIPSACESSIDRRWTKA